MKRLSTWLISVFWLSVFLIFCIRFWWLNIPEFWIYGYEFGQLINDLLMAYVTGYIFYYVVTLGERKRDKKNTYGIFAKIVDEIFLEKKYMYRELFDPKIPTLSDKDLVIDFAKLKENPDRLNFLAEHPLRFDASENRKLTFGEVLYNSIYSIDILCERLLSINLNLDSEAVNYVIEITDHKIHNHSNIYSQRTMYNKVVSKTPLKNSPEYVSLVLDSLESYFNKIDSLYRYKNKEVKRYLKTT